MTPWHRRSIIPGISPPEKVVEMYRAVGRELPGRVAVKIHSGEQGNTNFLGPDFSRTMLEDV